MSVHGFIIFKDEGGGEYLIDPKRVAAIVPLDVFDLDEDEQPDSETCEVVLAGGGRITVPSSSSELIGGVREFFNAAEKLESLGRELTEEGVPEANDLLDLIKQTLDL